MPSTADTASTAGTDWPRRTTSAYSLSPAVDAASDPGDGAAFGRASRIAPEITSGPRRHRPTVHRPALRAPDILSHMSTRRTSPSERAGDLDCTEMAAWAGLLRTHASLVRALDDEMQAEHGISLTQYEVLLLLARSDTGALRMNELADGALLSLSGLSRLVDRLVALGLVERAQCPTDRRGAFAVITAAGRARFAAARPTHLDGVRRRFIDVLPPDAVATLMASWELLEAAETPKAD